MNRSHFVMTVLLVAIVFVVTVAVAQRDGRMGTSEGRDGGLAGSGYDLAWHTIDGGGGVSAGGTFHLSGTIGQTDASTIAATGGTFEVAGGFWPAGNIVPQVPGDVTGDGLVNIDDLLAVIGAWGATGPNSADATGNGVVDIDDLLLVIGFWG